MQVFHQLEEIAPSLDRSVVAIGNFDGVHRGQVALLRRAMADAQSHGVPAVALTFYPHPSEVLKPATKLARLSTATEKLALLEGLGLDMTLVQPFDLALAAWSPEEFFERFLVTGLKARSVHVGFNFRFGKGRAGDTSVLQKLGASRGIQVEVASPVTADGAQVSSSRIRALIAEGNTQEAAKLLGRPYSVTGQVAHGDHRGAGLGFPTANVAFPDEKVLPKNGVYVTRAVWQRQAYRSVANVGVRPTFAAPDVRLEVHLLDFNARLYDEFLQVEFLERIRDERKFDSLEALKARIREDVEFARNSSSLRSLS